MDAFFSVSRVEQHCSEREVAAAAWRVRRGARGPSSVAHVVAAAVQATSRRAAGGCHRAAAPARATG